MKCVLTSNTESSFLHPVKANSSAKIEMLFIQIYFKDGDAENKVICHWYCLRLKFPDFPVFPACRLCLLRLHTISSGCRR